MQLYFGDLFLVRWMFEKGLSSLYLVAFISALNQYKALLGEKGLLPAPSFLKQTRFKDSPGLFHLHYSDRLVSIVCWIGILISLFILAGFLSILPWYGYILGWLVMWFLYMSIVNTGQTFYSFGWESMLLEAGFFAAFLGPADLEVPVIPVIILRWMLFRVEFGAGLIKLRHDPCWKDLTCLYYHYETQPMPGPLSWFFHHMPRFIHRFGVVFSHFVQLIVPFGIFAPQPFAQVAALLIIAHQLWLVLCGNYSWLNWLTIVLAFTALSDTLLVYLISIPEHIVEPKPLAFEILLLFLLGITMFLSWKPLLNFFSRDQLMNYCYNPLHLVCVYGAFGSVTKERYEVVIEATDDIVPDQNTVWKEYEFKGKPGSLSKMPRQFAPYHLRLDWAMWFLPFSVIVRDERIVYASTQLWFITLLDKLLVADPPTLALLSDVPFSDKKPAYIRALFYRYEFTSAKEKNRNGTIWKRKLIGEYLPPLNHDELKSHIDRLYGF